MPMRTRTHSTHTNLTSLMAATAAAAAAAAAATGSNKEVKDSLATHDSGGSVNEKREREGGRDEGGMLQSATHALATSTICGANLKSTNLQKFHIPHDLSPF